MLEKAAEPVKLMEDSRDITEKPAEAEGVRDYDITFRTTNLHDLTVTVHTWGDENRDKLTETAGSMGIFVTVSETGTISTSSQIETKLSENIGPETAVREVYQGSSLT